MKSREKTSPNPLRYAMDFIAPGSGGRPIFTLLLPDTCRYSCPFCPMSPVRRLPPELRSVPGLARLFIMAFRRGLCDGLFLTAGIPRNPPRAMVRIVELLELLRFHHGFRGYIHVKSVPGAPPGQVEKVVHLADRVSYQLEPACRRALLENPRGSPPGGMELFSSPEVAARQLRAALVQSARRAPEALPALGEQPSGRRQLPLWMEGRASFSEASARR